MTIKECRVKKTIMEQQIYEIVEEYEDKTGCQVKEIELLYDIEGLKTIGKTFCVMTKVIV